MSHIKLKNGPLFLSACLPEHTHIEHTLHFQFNFVLLLLYLLSAGTTKQQQPTWEKRGEKQIKYQINSICVEGHCTAVENRKAKSTTASSSTSFLKSSLKLKFSHFKVIARFVCLYQKVRKNLLSHNSEYFAGVHFLILKLSSSSLAIDFDRFPTQFARL